MKKLFFIAFYLIVLPVLFFAYGAELVDINTASLEQLDSLTGIGLKLGQKIIDNRPYASVDDLLKVQGIGPKNLEKIKQQGMATSTSIENIGTTNSIKQITDNETSTTESVSILADRHSLTQNNNQNIIPDNIFISEALPSPEGADTENEFIEIFNANNFEADISGFKIKDKIGAVKTFIIPDGTKIIANGFLTFKSSQTKISLNNTGDGVELLDPTGKIIDSVDFDKSKQGPSWSKVENTWAWTAKPTPNQANIMVLATANATSTFNTTSSKTNPLTANIQNYPPQKKNFLAVGIATIVALSSAIIAWRIKKNSTEV